MHKIRNSLIRLSKYLIPLYFLATNSNCSSTKPDFEVTYKYNTSYDIDTFYVKKEAWGLHVQVKVSEYGYETKLSRYLNNKSPTEPMVQKIGLISVKNAPKNIEGIIKSDFKFLNNKDSLVTKLYTDSNGMLEFKIGGLPYYELVDILSYKSYVTSGGLSEFELQEKEISKKGKRIGFLSITFNNQETFIPFKPVPPPNETDYDLRRWKRQDLERHIQVQKDMYNSYLRNRGDYRTLRNTFSIYGKETQFAIDEKKRKEEEERKKEEENKTREEEKKKREENEKRTKEEANLKKNEEDKRLNDLINLTINNNLEYLTISVVDEDNEKPIYGADVSITSDAKSPRDLLIDNGFPASRLNDFKIPYYPNSWNGDNWGNDLYCRTSNGSCVFQVFRTANNKVVVKHDDYYKFVDEFKSIKEGFNQTIKMSKIGTKVKLNLFGGRGSRSGK